MGFKRVEDNKKEIAKLPILTPQGKLLQETAPVEPKEEKKPGFWETLSDKQKVMGILAAITAFVAALYGVLQQLGVIGG